jgi:hypothetical protein
MKHTIGLFLVLITVAYGVVLGAGATPSVSVTETSLATSTDSLEVDYTVVALVIPRLPENQELNDAILELNMDVSCTLEDSLTGGYATVELTPMPTLVEGRLDVAATGPIIKRSIKVGSSQEVRIRITGLVRDALDELGENQDEAELSLLIGAISGQRYGRFEANVLAGGGGVKATITIKTKQRYDPEGAQ